MPARILVVEDHPDNLKLMTYLLKTFGHEVLAAGSGEDGLDIALRETFDLIICDIHLPGMDGYEVARRLRAEPSWSKVPLVAVTALAMVGDRDKILASGFDGYLAKPIVPQTFVQQVEAFLPRGLSREVLPSRTAGPASTRSVSANPSRGTLVLALDDTANNLKFLHALLEPVGFTLVTASTVHEAIAVIQANHIDLILSDVHLADESGFDLLRALKADPRLCSIPFVFFTSTALKRTDQEKALALGADRFLVRPIDPRRLLAEIEALLDTRKES